MASGFRSWGTGLALLATLALPSACSRIAARNHPTQGSPSFPELEGVYRQANRSFVVTYQGWWLDLSSQALRQLTPASDGGFSYGSGFMVETPAVGELHFHQTSNGTIDRVTGTGPGRVRVNATRLPTRSRNVTFPSRGATLAGTITVPPGTGPHPGLVILQGSGALDRHFESISNGIYLSLGFEVLSFDKRGVGQSTGSYPGDLATSESISIQAADAAAAASFLMRQPDIDPRRVGFDGNSQGGWVAPLAAESVPSLKFVILIAAPAVTTDQQDFYASLSGNSAYVPSLPDAVVDAQVRAQGGCQEGSSCYDPEPALRALRSPALWIYGELDRQVPVRVSIANLDAIRKPNWTVDVLARGNHGTLTTAHGLDSEIAGSNGFAGDYFTRLRTWLAQWVNPSKPA